MILNQERNVLSRTSVFDMKLAFDKSGVRKFLAQVPAVVTEVS